MKPNPPHSSVTVQSAHCADLQNRAAGYRIYISTIQNTEYKIQSSSLKMKICLAVCLLMAGGSEMLLWLVGGGNVYVDSERGGYSYKVGGLYDIVIFH